MFVASVWQKSFKKESWKEVSGTKVGENVTDNDNENDNDNDKLESVYRAQTPSQYIFTVQKLI